MFCPNCGTQNPDAAQTCSKCNFHLKSVAAPKFKGTMLMMNQASSPGGAPRPGGQAGPAGAGAPAMPSKLKGTMVGVAPMAGPGRGAPGPVAVPSPGAAPLGATTPAHPPGLGGNRSSEPAPAFSPLVPQPGVNPLGGTVAADGGAFNQGFPTGPAGGGSPFGGSVPQGTALMPGAGGPGQYSPFGAAPGPQGGPAHGSSNPPPYEPQGGAFGSSPPNPFGGPPAGYGAASAQPGQGPPMGGSPQAIMPYGQGAPMMAPTSTPPDAPAGVSRDALVALLPYAVGIGAAIFCFSLGAILAWVTGSTFIAWIFCGLGFLAVVGGVVWGLLNKKR